MSIEHHEHVLIHYSDKPVEFDRKMIYHSKTNWRSKPDGLWFSVQGEYDWNWWCRSEEFRLEYLAYEHKITLKKEANILYISDPDQLYEFTKKYRRPSRILDDENDTYELKWDEVAKIYQGIIIVPYLWDCRLALESSWYYGWDCASGCIWDLNCIESFELIQGLSECLT